MGFGEGSISAADGNLETLSKLDQIISNSPDIIVPIQRDDDGCSDGRTTIEVYDKNGTYTGSLNRPKVFGGAATMTAAISVGLGTAQGQSLQDVFKNAVKTLQQAGLNFGAHTDEVASGPNCGCGAIDKALETVTMAIKYETQIRGAITVLGFDTNGIDEVLDNFQRFADNKSSQLDQYSGSKTLEGILSAGKLIKKSGGIHKERRILINTVRGYTVNKNLVRQATNGEAQVFTLDAWRLDDIAAGVASDSSGQHKALLSELVYTFGTSAVLTRGNLPVYQIS